MRSVIARWGIDFTLLRTNGTFRTLFWGRLISIFGLSMLSVTVSIQVFELTQSSLQVALVGSVLGICSIIGSFFGGAIADRYDRRRVILVARGIAALGFLALAINAVVPGHTLLWIYLITAADAAAAACGAAAFGAAVPSVLQRKDLAASGAILALSLDIGAAIAPILAGALVAMSGVAGVYGVVCVLGIVSWVVLFRLPPLLPADAQPTAASDHVSTVHASAVSNAAEPASTGVATSATAVRGGRTADSARSAQPTLLTRATRGITAATGEALSFAAGDRIVRAVLLIGFIQILLASPFALIPEFVTTRLGGGEFEIGLLYSAPAVGALVAGLTSGWVTRVRRLALVGVIVFTCSALCIGGLGLSTELVVAALFLAAAGAGDVIGEIVRYTLLAARTPDRLRGRVTGIWQAQATVGDTIGGPILALIARAIGPGPAIALGGIAAALLTATMLIPKSIRQNLHDPEQESTA